MGKSELKIAEYSMSNSSKMSIRTMPGSEDYKIISLGSEKYFIEAKDNLSTDNISQNTLDNFSKLLAEYDNALRRLT